jgi:hypothetical protein
VEKNTHPVPVSVWIAYECHLWVKKSSLYPLGRVPGVYQIPVPELSSIGQGLDFPCWILPSSSLFYAKMSRSPAFLTHFVRSTPRVPRVESFPTCLRFTLGFLVAVLFCHFSRFRACMAQSLIIADQLVVLSARECQSIFMPFIIVLLQEPYFPDVL